MFKLVKRNKRMCIVNTTGQVVYSPPDFVRMINRNDLQSVVDKFNKKNSYDIKTIIGFESDIRFRADYRKKGVRK